MLVDMSTEKHDFLQSHAIDSCCSRSTLEVRRRLPIESLINLDAMNIALIFNTTIICTPQLGFCLSVAQADQKDVSRGELRIEQPNVKSAGKSPMTSLSPIRVASPLPGEATMSLFIPMYPRKSINC